jgi:hypothetical protein
MSFEAKKPAPRTGPAMRLVRSATVHAIGHEGNTLRVTYRSGKTYDYTGVSSVDFTKILNAVVVDTALRAAILTNSTGKLVTS